MTKLLAFGTVPAAAGFPKHRSPWEIWTQHGPGSGPPASLEIWGFEEASYFPMQQQISKSHMMKPLRKLAPRGLPCFGVREERQGRWLHLSASGGRAGGRGRPAVRSAHGRAGENSWPRALWGWVPEPFSGGALARQTQADRPPFPLSCALDLLCGPSILLGRQERVGVPCGRVSRPLWASDCWL